MFRRGGFFGHRHSSNRERHGHFARLRDADRSGGRFAHSTAFCSVMTASMNSGRATRSNIPVDNKKYRFADRPRVVNVQEI
jgi:hypothetical protein